LQNPAGMNMQDKGALVIPLYLDNHPEMEVAKVVINAEFAEEFNAGKPIKTHFQNCKEHGRELSHYSMDGSGKTPTVKIGSLIT